MKLISYRAGGGRPSVGAVLDGRVLDLADWLDGVSPDPATQACLAQAGLLPAAHGMLRLLQGGPQALADLQRHLAGRQPADGAARLADLELLAPVPRPGKIVAVGRNYADHAKETGVAPFEQPRIVSKLPSSVCAPGRAVPRPAGVAKLDFEAELAVVIGRPARAVAEADALACVAGYTVLDDVSAREFQFDVSPAQTTFAKSMDSFAPMGPWLVTADEVGDPQALTVRSWLNGELMQDASTADMLFPVATLIAYVSRFMTLEPGDVLATGTPAGIGAFRDPPVYLQPGDRLRMEVSRVGVLEHSITA
ncbi:fumarylacetoacetate hydrolase family protein [Bordetella sp. BOR01]|uniref:fumarylacetoacetate hydrolase family protein n=1 Tax=Bordetella sp. BOR01 TaxID=2854779 RepID=UPI001C45E556|nr:fumarylacetoacetate hydrolase family protein [Bordetella sp. BOR01]MBV7483994.1 fumarylacetoacetate hydrolase family protein [Bordetella sp. BOR01]